MDIQEQVLKVLTDIYGSGYAAEPESKIVNLSGVDSAEVIMAIEEEFEIIISDEDAEKLSTLKSVVEYLATRKTKKEE